MTIDYTDKYDLRDWLDRRYHRIGFLEHFLAATKGMEAASEEEFEEFVAQGLEDVLDHMGELAKGRGRSRRRMARLAVTWCLSEGWHPHDRYIAEATGDVLIWLADAGRDANLSVIRTLSLDVARSRRLLDDGRTTFLLLMDRFRHGHQKFDDHFDVLDDRGCAWRIWHHQYQGVAVLLTDSARSDAGR